MERRIFQHVTLEHRTTESKTWKYITTEQGTLEHRT